MRTSPSWWTGPSTWPRRARGRGGPPHEQVAELLRAYYRHVAAEDLADRSDVDVYGAFASHYKLAGNRPQGTAQVRVHTPTLSDSDWSAGGPHRGRGRRRRHAVPRRLADHGAVPPDARRARGHPPQLRRGPRHHRRAPVDDRRCRTAPSSPRARPSPRVVDARRDRPAARGRRPGTRSSRTSSACSATSARPSRTGARCTPRSRTSWPACAATRRRSTPEEVRQAAELLEWLADGALHLPRLQGVQARAARATTSTSSPTPGTGLGILRADQEMSASFGRLPDAVKAKAREKTLLVLAKANSRATVHRPAYLDYVGVKTFDAERRGRRRAPVPRPVLQRRLHRVADADPADPREGRRGPQAQRLRPAQPRRQGADGHARDLPARRAVPHAGRRARADGRGGDGAPASAARCGC